MRRAAPLITAVLVIAALTIAATRPRASAPAHATTAPSAAASTTPPRPVLRITRREVQAQHDLGPGASAERRRIARMELLNATLVTAAQAHGVSIVAGAARTSQDAPQQMVVTPQADLTVREIASAVLRICGALNDPCQRRDYRFLIQTASGQALLPPHLIDPPAED